MNYLWLFGLQIFAQLSLAFLFGFLIKRSFLALGAFLFYFFVFENIFVGLSRYYHSWFGEYLPLEISDRLVPPPAFMGKLDLDAYNKAIAGINKHIFLTIILTAIVWAICYWINKRKDLK
jgi:hypothetical protein